MPFITLSRDRCCIPQCTIPSFAARQIVALANLHPPVDGNKASDDGGDDLDSFMYQTVGFQLIDALAACLNKPLYKRAIRGKSLQTGLHYQHTAAASAPHPINSASSGSDTATERNYTSSGDAAAGAGGGVADELKHINSSSDEVEDMLELLAMVKAKHPEIDAVSSGMVSEEELLSWLWL